jgi:hypothetical protein
MQKLGIEWCGQLGQSINDETLEPPPPGLNEASVLDRPVALVEQGSGRRIISEGDQTERLLDDGWIPDLTDRDNFLEGAHIQAYYFQVRWFPRLKWFTLRPPAGEFFVIGDRPVGWGLPDCLDAPPSCLRDPSAFLIAPISSGLALVGKNRLESWSVTPRQVNSILATWSQEWIAGSTKQVVLAALHDRAN